MLGRMSDYRRNYVPGGTFFFTVVANGRRPILVSDVARHALRQAFREVRSRHPFSITAGRHTSTRQRWVRKHPPYEITKLSPPAIFLRVPQPIRNCVECNTRQQPVGGCSHPPRPTRSKPPAPIGKRLEPRPTTPMPAITRSMRQRCVRKHPPYKTTKLTR